MHYPPMIGRPNQPEYPAAGARIDYYLASPSGEVKLEILDAAGKVVRSYSSEARAAAAGGRGGGRRGGGLPTTLPTKVGMNRFVWDLRYAGGPARRRRRRRRGFGGGGPMVAPGSFKARLTAGGATRTESFTVKIDPRIAKDGTTVANLADAGVIGRDHRHQAQLQIASRRPRPVAADATGRHVRRRRVDGAQRGGDGAVEARDVVPPHGDEIHEKSNDTTDHRVDAASYQQARHVVDRVSAVRDRQRQRRDEHHRKRIVARHQNLDDELQDTQHQCQHQTVWLEGQHNAGHRQADERAQHPFLPRATVRIQSKP